MTVEMKPGTTNFASNLDPTAVSKAYCSGTTGSLFVDSNPQEPYTIPAKAACVPQPAGNLSVALQDKFDETQYENSQFLDADQQFKLLWTANMAESSIKFAMKVQTSGWIGVGFSANGGDGAL